MICPNCGKEISESKFCPECGAKTDTDDTPASQQEAINDNSYYEALKKIEKEKKQEQKSKKKKKRIGCLAAVIVIILLVLSPIVGLKIADTNKKREEAKVRDALETQDISFSTIKYDYKTNASLAGDTYNEKKYSFYFIPHDIEEDGRCRGLVFDSKTNPWDVEVSSHGESHTDFDLYFDKESAKTLIKGHAYKLEGIFSIYYDDDHSSFTIYVNHIKIVEDLGITDYDKQIKRY